jgi:predicted RNA-binding protein associated with RNAse of E/G family
VNLELPWTRTRIGFDTHDLILDVAIEGGDLSSARLKDQDELAWSEEHGTISREEAQLAREEADRVLRLIADRSGVFAADWERWQPDPSWPVAELPPDWKSA